MTAYIVYNVVIHVAYLWIMRWLYQYQSEYRCQENPYITHHLSLEQLVNVTGPDEDTRHDKRLRIIHWLRLLHLERIIGIRSKLVHILRIGLIHDINMMLDQTEHSRFIHIVTIHQTERIHFILTCLNLLCNHSICTHLILMTPYWLYNWFRLLRHMQHRRHIRHIFRGLSIWCEGIMIIGCGLIVVQINQFYNEYRYSSTVYLVYYCSFVVFSRGFIMIASTASIILTRGNRVVQSDCASVLPAITVLLLSAFIGYASVVLFTLTLSVIFVYKLYILNSNNTKKQPTTSYFEQMENSIADGFQNAIIAHNFSKVIRSYIEYPTLRWTDDWSKTAGVDNWRVAEVAKEYRTPWSRRYNQWLVHENGQPVCLEARSNTRLDVNGSNGACGVRIPFSVFTHEEFFDRANKDRHLWNGSDVIRLPHIYHFDGNRAGLYIATHRCEQCHPPFVTRTQDWESMNLSSAMIAYARTDDSWDIDSTSPETIEQQRSRLRHQSTNGRKACETDRSPVQISPVLIYYEFNNNTE